MLAVQNVTMRYGAKILFEDVTTTFNPGRRYGLTGPNGSGKSTFMKILSGELEQQMGNVIRPRKMGISIEVRYRTHRRLRSLRALSSPHRRSFFRTWSTLTVGPKSSATSLRVLKAIGRPQALVGYRLCCYWPSSFASFSVSALPLSPRLASRSPSSPVHSLRKSE